MAMKFALLGTGFWSYFQLAGWQELKDVECVAMYNRTVAKAEALAAKLAPNARIYADPEEMLDKEDLDFIDVCTSVDTHALFTKMGAERGLDIVSQKPFAVSLEEARQMLDMTNKAGVALLINENWRWQYPIRQLRAKLQAGNIGKPYRARIHYVNSFPVFDNQPFLKELEQFILTDIGSHILDTARSLFGDARSLFAQTHRLHADIKGEDMATVMLETNRGMTVVCEMSYASKTEIERFPETYIYIEGDKGFLELGPDFWIRQTTETGTWSKRFPPPRYLWADPAYDVVHSSIVACQDDLLKHLKGEVQAETRAEENIKTVEMVFKAYESAANNQVVRL